MKVSVMFYRILFSTLAGLTWQWGSFLWHLQRLGDWWEVIPAGMRWFV